MTITANDIIIRLWALANMDPNKTNGKTCSQRRAFKLILDIRGGIGFLACRPETELEELARRGVCSADWRTILREIAHVESRYRKAQLDPATRERQMRRLRRAAAQPGNSMGCVTKPD
jgi:hypothetical protein